MKKILSILAMLILTMALSVPAFAATTGTATITVDTATETPESFKNQDFYICFMGVGPGEIYEFNILASDLYKGTFELPFGEYTIANAGVAQDFMGKLALECDQKFTLNEKTPTFEATLKFSNFSETAGRPVEAPKNGVAEIEYPKNPEAVYVTFVKNDKNFEFKLTPENQYHVMEMLNVGTYHLKSIVSESGVELHANTSELVIEADKTTEILIFKEISEILEYPTVSVPVDEPEETPEPEPTPSPSPSVDEEQTEQEEQEEPEKHSNIFLDNLLWIVLIVVATIALVIYKIKTK
ncbi:MAG: hypothetical protein RR162_01245 [Oscillospiraceae bacterium]